MKHNTAHRSLILIITIPSARLSVTLLLTVYKEKFFEMKKASEGFSFVQRTFPQMLPVGKRPPWTM